MAQAEVLRAGDRQPAVGGGFRLLERQRGAAGAPDRLVGVFTPAGCRRGSTCCASRSPTRPAAPPARAPRRSWSRGREVRGRAALPPRPAPPPLAPAACGAGGAVRRHRLGRRRRGAGPGGQGRQAGARPDGRELRGLGRQDEAADHRLRGDRPGGPGGPGPPPAGRRRCRPPPAATSSSSSTSPSHARSRSSRHGRRRRSWCARVSTRRTSPRSPPTAPAAAASWCSASPPTARSSQRPSSRSACRSSCRRAPTRCDWWCPPSSPRWAAGAGPGRRRRDRHGAPQADALEGLPRSSSGCSGRWRPASGTPGGPGLRRQPLPGGPGAGHGRRGRPQVRGLPLRGLPGERRHRHGERPRQRERGGERRELEGGQREALRQRAGAVGAGDDVRELPPRRLHRPGGGHRRARTAGPEAATEHRPDADVADTGRTRCWRWPTTPAATSTRTSTTSARPWARCSTARASPTCSPSSPRAWSPMAHSTTFEVRLKGAPRGARVTTAPATSRPTRRAPSIRGSSCCGRGRHAGRRGGRARSRSRCWPRGCRRGSAGRDVPLLLEIDGPASSPATSGRGAGGRVYAYALDAQQAVRGFLTQHVDIDLDREPERRSAASSSTASWRCRRALRCACWCATRRTAPAAASLPVEVRRRWLAGGGPLVSPPLFLAQRRELGGDAAGGARRRAGGAGTVHARRQPFVPDVRPVVAAAGGARGSPRLQPGEQRRRGAREVLRAADRQPAAGSAFASSTASAAKAARPTACSASSPRPACRPASTCCASR